MILVKVDSVEERKKDSLFGKDQLKEFGFAVEEHFPVVVEALEDVAYKMEEVQVGIVGQEFP